MIRILFIVTLLGWSIQLGAQSLDTLSGTADEVVVTATRTERKLSNVAVPVIIVSNKIIERAGSLRLKDILQEQTGLFITNGFGAGVQLQGLSPDYTLILIDGEPLVGRTAGVLDLNRLNVGNIKKIEIVKGPGSSLYGSEAMAGVINIITEKPAGTKLDAGLRYGTYNTFDALTNASYKKGAFSASGHMNYYRTDGFSIRPFTVERTVAPLNRFTQQWQFGYSFSTKTKFTVSFRNATEQITNELGVTNNGVITYSKGREENKDVNINPVLTHQFNDRVKTILRLYNTTFSSLQELNTTGNTLYSDYLWHQFNRIENQTDYQASKNLQLTFGAGQVNEYVRSTRYDNVNNKRSNDVTYGFTQADWIINTWLTVIGGLRYDDNRLYAAALSPKLALRAKLNTKLFVNASVGRGFKAPDFRQLYLNFTNTAAGGYSVYGSLEAQKVINELNRLGQIESLEADFYRLTNLQPEQSTGWNIGIQWLPEKSWKFNVNLFRNDITNLIDSRLVAYKKGGSQIFSYLNVRNAVTQGAELELLYQLNKYWQVQAGYQLLYTADLAQLNEIKAGRVFTRDAGGFSRLMKRSEYFGLPNRSRHMANMKISYEHPKNWFANLRAIYRSKWAVNDIDGNGLFNSNDGFANGMLLVNISAGKKWKNNLQTQVGIDNLSNYTDVFNLPNMPGRQYYLRINYTIIQNKNK